MSHPNRGAALKYRNVELFAASPCLWAKPTVYELIKMSLRRDMRRVNESDCVTDSVDQRNRQAVMRQFEFSVNEMTKCMKLGSLNVHYCFMLMAVMTSDNPATIRTYFRGIQHSAQWLRSMVANVIGLGNAFTESTKTFHTNFQNNVWIHGHGWAATNT